MSDPAVEPKTYSEEEYGDLKTKLDEFRSNNVTLLKKQEDLESKFNGIDVDAYNDMLKTSQALKDKKLIDEGKIDELLEERTKAMRNEHNLALEGMNKTQSALNGKLETLLIDNAVRDSAAKAGVVDTALDDVVLRSQIVFSVKDGKAVPHDREGNVVFGDGTSDPMSVNEWVKGLTESAPHLFNPSTGGGSQHGSTFNGNTNTVSRTVFDKMSQQQRSKFAIDGGKVVDK
ncbi:hypothetical protein HN803_05355 [candidate division WWE3 bacterium]|jgi:hypothetical protein|nr:hypothetical protein [candidate division WWE3 bacterium]